MALIAFAGISKLTSLREFEASLYSWGVGEGMFRRTVAVSIPVLEVGIAAAWFFGVVRKWALLASMALVVTATVTYLWLWAAGKQPECRCLGQWMRYKNAIDAVPWLVLRNTGMLIALAAPEVVVRARPGASRGAGPRSRELSRGVTIIELVLVIALVGVLMSLAVPTITRTRHRAARLATLATIGSHAKVISAYASDHRDYFPAFTDPAATYTVLYVDDNPIKLVYFDTYWSWHLALAKDTYGANWGNGMFQEDGSGSAIVNSIWYSSSVGADPAFWNDTTRTGPTQWRATRFHEVRYTSQKAVFFASKAWSNERRAAPLSFCDGSAEDVPAGRLVPGYPNGTGDWPGSGLAWPFPGMMTFDGVRGRDR
ncbi:MAG: hypothetical protein GIKADHBN_01244 [Phycisphaerales bacterium]|nr:hypothetical protein [Phycisphaerales bacterium]